MLLDVSYTPVDVRTSPKNRTATSHAFGTQVLTWQRAVLMSLYAKAEVLEYYDVSIRSARQEHPVPAVVRLPAAGDGGPSLQAWAWAWACGLGGRGLGTRYASSQCADSSLS